MQNEYLHRWAGICQCLAWSIAVNLNSARTECEQSTGPPPRRGAPAFSGGRPPCVTPMAPCAALVFRFGTWAPLSPLRVSLGERSRRCGTAGKGPHGRGDHRPPPPGKRREGGGAGAWPCKRRRTTPAPISHLGDRGGQTSMLARAPSPADGANRSFAATVPAGAFPAPYRLLEPMQAKVLERTKLPQ